MLKIDTKDKLLVRNIAVALYSYSEGVELKAKLAVGPEPEVKVTVLKQEATVTDEKPEVVEPEEPIDVPAPKSGNVDEKGVAFDSNYCGKAKVPFYQAGNRNGQWKKARGLDESVYDSWYAGELLKLGTAAKPTDTKPAVETPPDTTAAFGGQSNNEPEGDEDVPTDAGSLMVWMSEMQTAGRLQESDLQNVYENSGFTPGDLFSGKDGAVQGIYQALKSCLK